MKKIILLAIMFAPGCVLSVPQDTLEKNLNYCSSMESWAAQKVISRELSKDKQLDGEKATSLLINRTRLEKGNIPVKLGDWGQLYTQTIAITIPYIHKQKKPLTFIASSIISAAECSLTDPAYIDSTSEHYSFN